MTSVAVLERARAGDERAFRELVAPYGPELRVHCYRMLGSLSDADDALQEIAMINAWNRIGVTTRLVAGSHR